MSELSMRHRAALVWSCLASVAPRVPCVQAPCRVASDILSSEPFTAFCVGRRLQFPALRLSGIAAGAFGTPRALLHSNEQQVGPLPPARHPYPQSLPLTHPRGPAASPSCWPPLFSV